MDVRDAIWLGFMGGSITFGWILPWIGKILKK